MAVESRYTRQMALPGWGEEGQRRLGRSRVLLVGCGGLGGLAAQLLVRGGLGRLRLIDDDRVNLSNLHRQILFTEEDAAAGRLKVEAASEKLRAANREVALESLAARAGPENLPGLLQGMDLVVDASDSQTTRVYLNEACVAAGLPLVHGAVSQGGGQVMAVVPGRGPCLRCLMPELPSEPLQGLWGGAAVLGPAPAMVAALQVSLAFKLLVGGAPEPGRLFLLDAWGEGLHVTHVPRNPGCPTCGRLGAPSGPPSERSPES